MTGTTKKDLAVQFINAIQTMDPDKLHALIVREAGEDLAQFFLSYSMSLIRRDPDRALENVGSVMLMGYLIRAHQDRGTLGHPEDGLRFTRVGIA